MSTNTEPGLPQDPTQLRNAQPIPPTTGPVPHSGTLPDAMREIPVEYSDKPLAETILQPPHTPHALHAPEVPSTTTQPEKRIKTWHKAAAVVGALAVVGGAAGVLSAKGSTSKGRGSATPSSSSPNQPTTPSSSGSSSETLASDPTKYSAKLASVVAQYHLQLQSTPYTVYITGTQLYAAEEQLPNEYYDLSQLTQPLSLQDYTRLTPVYINNEFMTFNTTSTHYQDTGSGTQFGSGVNTTPAAYLIGPETGTFNGFQTGLVSYDTPGHAYMGAYDGPIAKYDGEQVVTLDITGVPVRDISTQGRLGKYIDSDAGNFSPMSEGGPTLDIHLQFDPKTNNVITDSDKLHY